MPDLSKVAPGVVDGALARWVPIAERHLSAPSARDLIGSRADVAQQARLLVLELVSTWDPAKGPVDPYVGGLLKRRCAGAHKKASRLSGEAVLARRAVRELERDGDRATAEGVARLTGMPLARARAALEEEQAERGASRTASAGELARAGEPAAPEHSPAEQDARLSAMHRALIEHAADMPEAFIGWYLRSFAGLSAYDVAGLIGATVSEIEQDMEELSRRARESLRQRRRADDG